MPKIEGFEWNYGTHDVTLPESVVEGIVSEHFEILFNDLAENASGHIAHRDPLRIYVGFDSAAKLDFYLDVREMLEQELRDNEFNDSPRRTLFLKMLAAMDEYELAVKVSQPAAE